MPLLHRILGRTAAAVLAVCVTGCDEPSDGPDDPASGAPAGKADSAGEPPALADVYGVRVTSNVKVRNAEGDVATHTTEVVALAFTEQAGEAVDLELVPCAIDLPATDFQTKVSTRVIDSLDSVSIRGAAFREGGGQPRLSTDPAAILAGVSMSDPLGQAMPDDPDDPSFFDQDGDGEPGVSIGVSAFTVYAAARVIIGIDGAIDTDGSITGDADVELNFAILGDSIPFVDARERAEESAVGSQVLDRDHRFWMTPLTSASCDEAMSQL